jgi:hypothetical protein
MAQSGSIAELIDLSIAIERITAAIYGNFAALFTEVPDVAAFWTRYAHEETGHANWMRNLRSRVGSATLESPADSDVWEMAVRTSSVVPDEVLAGIDTLQDAYELANEIEHGETNAIFDFLVSNFSEDEKTVMFVRNQLREHVGYLMNNFPQEYHDVVFRRKVKAVRV